MSPSITVLHVDDEPDFAELVSEFLPRESDRIDVVTETDAGDALERVEEKRGEIDCVVSDYDMPKMDGLELLEEVRDMCPDLPFILFTGKGSEQVASEAISAGVTDYLRKESGTEKYELLANRIEKDVERRRSRRELRESRKRLDLFFEQSPLGVVEWDDEFRLVRMNEHAEEILGYDESELRGRSWEPIVPESDRNQVARVVEDLLENEGGYHSVNENVTKDGERVVCEWHNRVVTDEDGETVGVFSQFRDVTERAEREEELRRSERRFEAVFEDPKMLVGLLDTDGTLLDGNEKAMEYVEAGADDVVGELFWETPWWDDETRDEVKRWVGRAAEGEYVEYEADLRQPDGTPYSVEGTMRPVTDEDDEVVSLVVSASDVTERKERERAIERRNEMLEEVSGFLSHDLRTPLSTVRGRLELALETGETDHVEKASVALDRVDELLADMVDTLRTGEVVGDTEEIDLEEAMETILETVRVPETASVEVVGSPHVKGDEDAVRRLLENLVSNSVEHAEDDVRIRLGRLENGFYYEDDGPGIPEEDRQDVFKPGFSTKEDEKGSGMGMASVRRIVLAHGWEMCVGDAEELGGARFEVRTGERK